MVGEAVDKEREKWFRGSVFCRGWRAAVKQGANEVSVARVGGFLSAGWEDPGLYGGMYFEMDYLTSKLDERSRT